MSISAMAAWDLYFAMEARNQHFRPGGAEDAVVLVKWSGGSCFLSTGGQHCYPPYEVDVLKKRSGNIFL